jgi:hypothetical protein
MAWIPAYAVGNLLSMISMDKPAPEAVDTRQAEHERLDTLDDPRLHHHDQENDEALKTHVKNFYLNVFLRTV